MKTYDELLQLDDDLINRIDSVLQEHRSVSHYCHKLNQDLDKLVKFVK